jgi:multidrug efflux pump subunit AcrB
MNIAEYCIRRKTTTSVLAVVLLLGGLSSYFGMSRLEDPEFTIKDALVITSYPGASPHEVEEEVTDEIETAIQQLGELDEMVSRSERGLSTITVSIKDKYDADTLPQVWDELRRKVSDAQVTLPPGAGTTVVIDDYGAVYGVYLVLYGNDFSYAELKHQADFLKRELLLVDDVARIEIHGQRSEAIYIEPIRDRLSQLDMSPQELLVKLREQNLVQDTGRMRIGPDFITLNPTGELKTVQDFEQLTFAHNYKKFYLRDFAEVRRGYIDPPKDIVRYNGHNSIALGISTVSGGNVVTMGEAMDHRLEELKQQLPLGMEVGVISHQASSVSKAIDNFIMSLLQALAIVIAVLLLFMGLRSGLLIGAILVITIMGSFIFLKPMGVALERISLGALIIALGMLVDNAIVIVDGILVELKRGKSAKEGAIRTVKQSAIPLLGATTIAVLAFAAIGTTDNAAGEFCRSLFRVIAVSLFLSWVTAVTITPLLAVMVLKEPKDAGNSAKEPFSNGFYRFYKSLLSRCIRWRWVTVTVVLAMFASAVWGFGYVKQSFFPPSTRAQYMVDVWMPQGTHIEGTTDEVKKLEDWLDSREGIGNVTSLIGRGGLRFLLTYKPELPNTSYAQLIIDVDDPSSINEHIEATESFIAKELPDAMGYGVKFELGPGGKGKIQARFLGPDPNELRRLAAEAESIMRDTPNTKAQRTDWRQRVKVLRPKLVEDRANLLGIHKGELSHAIRQAYQGETVGVYRDGDLLLPIIVRAPHRERSTISQLDNIQIWSPVAQKRLPITQVISDIDLVFEDEILMRFDRKPMITTFCDPVQGTASSLFKKLQPKIEAIPLPDGYELVWFGEYKDSGDANRALAKGIPLFALLMVLTTIALFNSLRQPLVIWLCVPLALIGVSFGLLVTNQAFTFMALLGFLSLSGMLIKNAIVMIDELNVQLSSGKEAFPAIIDSAASRLMPVAMAAATTILGMIPLFFDDFFAAMAVTIIFGLLFATVLTLVVLPVLYAIIFRVKTNDHSGI